MNAAMPMASLKPFRKTAPSTTSSSRVMPTSLPCRKPGTSGFSTMCTAASAAERVIVTIHAVATNPSRTRTRILPFQNESRFSSIAIEPCPLGLSRETTRYIGSIPNRVRSTMSNVAMGESAPAAGAAQAGGGAQRGRGAPPRAARERGEVARSGGVLPPGQAHHLPPGVLLLALPGLRALHLLDALLEQPTPEPAGPGCLNRSPAGPPGPPPPRRASRAASA